MSTATERGGYVTHNEGVLLIKSHDRYIMCSCEIVSQTKTIVSPLP